VIGKNHDNFSLMDLAQAWERKTRWVLATGVQIAGMKGV
jgi:hypothetical protein